MVIREDYLYSVMQTKGGNRIPPLEFHSTRKIKFKGNDSESIRPNKKFLQNQLQFLLF